VRKLSAWAWLVSVASALSALSCFVLGYQEGGVSRLIASGVFAILAVLAEKREGGA
jgi:hypothetical protein